MSMEQLIRDNPNLNSSVIARLTGVSESTVKRHRVKPHWYHSGCGIPYLSFDIFDGSYVIGTKRRTVYRGTFAGAMENIDRLLYCLDHNQGRLPLTRREFYFKDLEYDAQTPSRLHR